MAKIAGSLPTTDKGWQAYIQNVKPPQKRTWHALGGGLVVCLEQSGAKTFQARIRRRGDQNPRRIVIGHFPAASVADARQRLAELKSLAKEGMDPQSQQRRAKLSGTEPRILSELIEEYLRRRQADLAPKSYRNEAEQLAVISSAIGDRLLSDIHPRDIAAVVHRYADKLRAAGRSNGTSANKVLAATKRLYRTAKGWGLIKGENPAQDLSSPAKEVPRRRILPDGKVLISERDPYCNETGTLLAAIRDQAKGLPIAKETGVALQLCLLLGLRASEACGLEWSAIRLEQDVPTLTVTRSKTRAGHRTLPLPKQACDLLLSIKPNGKNAPPFVFPPAEGARRASHLHPESLSRAFARISDRLGIERVVLHDLRRTCLSGLIELGHSEVAERIAGHEARTVLGRHYDRSNRIEAMRSALCDWANALDLAHGRSLSFAQ